MPWNAVADIAQIDEEAWIEQEKDDLVATDAASEKFVRDLIERGEAVKVAPGEPLPPGATHEIVGVTPRGQPVLRRKRFSVF